MTSDGMEISLGLRLYTRITITFSSEYNIIKIKTPVYLIPMGTQSTVNNARRLGCYTFMLLQKIHICEVIVQW
jgi:hypothetical protein